MYEKYKVKRNLLSNNSAFDDNKRQETRILKLKLFGIFYSEWYFKNKLV